MGYISTERVKEIRNELKSKFPKVKFSVTREHGSTVGIAIMESPFDWKKSSEQINDFYPEHHENADFLKEIIAIAKAGTTERETGDYGTQPSHYVSLSVGKWNKEHKKI